MSGDVTLTRDEYIKLISKPSPAPEPVRIEIDVKEHEELIKAKELYEPLRLEVDRLTWALRQGQTALKQEQRDHAEELALLYQKFGIPAR